MGIILGPAQLTWCGSGSAPTLHSGWGCSPHMGAGSPLVCFCDLLGAPALAELW